MNEEQQQLPTEGLSEDLRELLDSQLNKQPADGTRLRSVEGAIPADGKEEPTKEFRTAEIAAFMNNQIRKQQVQMEETGGGDGTSYEQQQSGDENQAQQHVILVTQNGDKIILIQNPSAVGDGDSAEIDTSQLAVAAAVGAGDNERQMLEYQPSVEIGEQEEYQIQLQHKIRQKMLMMQLDKLRGRKAPTQTPDAVSVEPNEEEANNGSPSSATPYDYISMESSSSKNFKRPYTSTSSSYGNTKKKVVPELNKSTRNNMKWYQPMNIYLNKAFNYVQRRGNKVEQIGKFFPSSSHSFDVRCAEMKQSLLKVELNIERFQNILDQELEAIDGKLQSFAHDFHLESFISEIEVEDEQDCEDMPEPPKGMEIVHQIPLSSDSSNNMQLITPPTISISAALVPYSASGDISNPHEPVPEVRDIYDFDPLPETFTDSSDLDARYLPAPNSKTTISMKPASLTRACGISRPYGGRGQSKILRTRAGSPYQRIFKCRHSLCREEFHSNAELMSHLNSSHKSTTKPASFPTDKETQDQYEFDEEEEDDEDEEEEDDAMDDYDDDDDEEYVVDSKMNGVRHFKCYHRCCGKSYTSNAKLRQHRSNAHGHGRHRTSLAQNRASPKNVLRHAKNTPNTNSGMKPFQCERCKVEYRYHKALVNHYKRNHPEYLPSDPLTADATDSKDKSKRIPRGVHSVTLISSNSNQDADMMGEDSFLRLSARRPSTEKSTPRTHKPGPASKTGRPRQLIPQTPVYSDTDENLLTEDSLKDRCINVAATVILKRFTPAALVNIENHHIHLGSSKTDSQSETPCNTKRRVARKSTTPCHSMRSSMRKRNIEDLSTPTKTSRRSEHLN